MEKCVLIPFIKYQRLLKQQQIGGGEKDNPYEDSINTKTELVNKILIKPPPPGKSDIISSQDKSEISSWADNWETVHF